MKEAFGWSDLFEYCRFYLEMIDKELMVTDTKIGKYRQSLREKIKIVKKTDGLYGMRKKEFILAQKQYIHPQKGEQ